MSLAHSESDIKSGAFPLGWESRYLGLRDVHCWELVCQIYEDQLNLYLPRAGGERITVHSLGFHRSHVRKKWSRVVTPQTGDIVLMGTNHHKYASHAGVVASLSTFSPMKVLHTTKRETAYLQEVTTLVDDGWVTRGFYRYVEIK